jgi:hypothetical protein
MGLKIVMRFISHLTPTLPEELWAAWKNLVTGSASRSIT